VGDEIMQRLVAILLTIIVGLLIVLAFAAGRSAMSSPTRTSPSTTINVYYAQSNQTFLAPNVKGTLCVNNIVLGSTLSTKEICYVNATAYTTLRR
jgi:hypothetical protein